MGRGKNVRKIHVQKAILFIESELQISYLFIKHPEISHQIKNRLSSLKWNISDSEIIELARSLYASKRASNNGKDATFIDIVRDLELLFGRKVKRPHNKATRISERVDVASFLDTLKESYIDDLEARL